MLGCCFIQLPGYSQISLSNYSYQQEQSFNDEYNSALKIFNKWHYKSKYKYTTGEHLQLIRFYNNVPLFYTTHNATSALFLGIPPSYETTNWHEGLTGEGMEIGLWDAGHVFSLHQEFTLSDEPRILIEEEVPVYANHSTHLGGSIAASGINPLAKGMAYKSSIYSRDYMNDLAEMSNAAEKRASFISNHSYGPVGGWSYNTTEEQWYWYGDVGISDIEDYKFGFYGSIPAALDQLAYLAPYYLMVISAGNDRDDAPTQPLTHKVWIDKWKDSNDIREPDGGTTGYDCLEMNAVSKNALTIGAVDATSNGDMSVFSAWGPTDDGRIKPDLSAPGVRILSCLADNDDAYGYYSGTSMAAACVSGGLLLIQQLQEKLRPEVPLLSSSLKGILIQTADESGPYPGPDYQFGWGLVNFEAAHNLLEENIASGGALVIENNVAKNLTFEHTVSMEQSKTLKVTLVWTDPPGSANQPALNPVDLKLVNDLDLQIKHIETGTIYKPWVLNPTSPGEPAQKGINIRDNLEQVIIENCLEGSYSISISALKIRDMSQSFSLIMSGHKYQTGLYPPVNLDGFYIEGGISLTWSPPNGILPQSYQIFRDGAMIGSSNDVTFIDKNTNYFNTVTYQVASYYNMDLPNTSYLSNKLKIKLLPIAELTYEDDFEVYPDVWTFSGDDHGWRWGKSNDLNSDYLHFDDNTSQFMGINSDALGSSEHVVDYLITQPIKVPINRDMDVGFKYYFNNDTYATNDRFELLYRSSINGDWNLIQTLSSHSNWGENKIRIKPNDGVNVIQFGLLYDDGGEWGAGAAIDNFQILDSISNAITENKSEGSKIYVDTNQILHIELEEGNYKQVKQVSIFDLGGRIVFTQHEGTSNTKTITIPLTHLSKGGYLVSIKTVEAITSKLVVLY